MTICAGMGKSFALTSTVVGRQSGDNRAAASSECAAETAR